MLDDLAVGADGHQADIGHVAFAPVPLVELLQRAEALLEQLLVLVALVHPLQSPAQDRDLRIGRISEPVVRVAGLDHARDHVVRVVRPLRVPALLEIPVVLKDVPDEGLRVGQQRQEIDDEHRVPDPLAVEGGVAGARIEPPAFQGSFRRLDLGQHALPEEHPPPAAEPPGPWIQRASGGRKGEAGLRRGCESQPRGTSSGTARRAGLGSRIGGGSCSMQEATGLSVALSVMNNASHHRKGRCWSESKW